MSTNYWVVYPVGENTGGVLNPVTPAGTKILATTAGSTEDTTISNGGSVDGYTRFMGPFSSQSAAASANPPSGLSAIIDITGGAVGAATNATIGNPLAGIAAVGDFFQRLTQGSTWLRIGEVFLGLLFLAVGISKLTNTVPAATKVAAVLA
jgi:hypothetical protein